MNFVEKNRDTGCWMWTGALHPAGYGRFTEDQVIVMAHRAAYELFRGPIQNGLSIDHLCRVRACVNPDHLEAVTMHTNLHRAPNNIAARNAAKTHCPQGHPYSGANVLMDTTRRGTPMRRCLICTRAQAKVNTRRYKDKQRQLNKLPTR